MPSHHPPSPIYHIRIWDIGIRHLQFRVGTIKSVQFDFQFDMRDPHWHRAIQLIKPCVASLTDGCQLFLSVIFVSYENRGQKKFAASRRFLDVSDNFRKSILLHDLILYFFKKHILEHKLKFNEADNRQLTPEITVAEILMKSKLMCSRNTNVRASRVFQSYS